MALLPSAPHQRACLSGESEMVKYFMNTFLAMKNTFANQLYDYCKHRGIDYDTVKDIVKDVPRMGGPVHLNIFQDGYRGFQGACLPKDITALVRDAAKDQKPLRLLALVEELNRSYIAEKPEPKKAAKG